jgi:hypothetical protein
MKKNTFLLGMLLFACWATGAFANLFGSHGAHGANGAHGAKGSEGENVAVHADGTPQHIDLAGLKGADGHDGSRGKEAFACFPPLNPKYNLQGANGGNGGNGGNGNKGGNGGFATIYYDNIDHLKDIAVSAAGGVGGQAGRGGGGGNACTCNSFYWVASDNHSYNCFSGKNGAQGKDGKAGKEGSMGGIFLVPTSAGLPTITPTTTTTIGQWLNSPISVSKHLWSMHSGAAQLLAPGTEVQDTYQLFERLIKKEITLAWNANTSMGDLAKTSATITYGQGPTDEDVSIQFGRGTWIRTAITDIDSEHRKINITDIFRDDDARQITLAGVEGHGTHTSIVLRDDGPAPQAFTTAAYLKVEAMNVMWYATRFDGMMDSSLISTDGKYIAIQIGRIPGLAKYLHQGKHVRLTLAVTRGFDNFSTEVSILDTQKLRLK